MSEDAGGSAKTMGSRMGGPLDPRRAAERLVDVSEGVKACRKTIEQKLGTEKGADPQAPGKPAGKRAADITEGLRRTLRRWHDFYAGYDPEFTWWVKQPFEEADKKLAELADFLRKRVAGFTDGLKKASTGEDGKQYFVPFYYYPWAVFYRKSLFQQRGYTPFIARAGQ